MSLRHLNPFCISLLCLLILMACGRNKGQYTLEDFKSLNSLNTKLSKPAPGEWLYNQTESGQSFDTYINSNPVRPSDAKEKVYLHLLGTFDSTDLYVLERLQTYTEGFLGLKVITKGPTTDSIIPVDARRIHQGHEQLHTTYFLRDLLVKNFPDGALLNIAITSKDLYPSESWNFVFGQASLKDSVGVSSIYRYKNADSGAINLKIYTERIIKTTTHEILHALSLKHCKDYKCLMNGSNSLSEADKKPTWLCGECLAKLMHNSKSDMTNRYDQLIHFWQENGFPEKALFYQQSKELFAD